MKANLLWKDQAKDKANKSLRYIKLSTVNEYIMLLGYSLSFSVYDVAFHPSGNLLVAGVGNSVQVPTILQK